MEQSKPITIFKYEESDIAFKTDDGTAMVNATQMAKPFSKRPNDWIGLQSTKDFMEALSVTKNIGITSLLITKRGNFADKREQGTWMHEDVALEFARWLSPMFAIWCNDRIKELLRNGITTVSPKSVTELRKLCELQADNLALYKNLNNLKTLLNKSNQLMNAAISLLPKLATTTDIASRYGMTAKQLNDRLEKVNVIRRMNGNIYIAEEYADSGLSVDCPYCENDEDIKNYLRWSRIGQVFLFLLIKHNFNTGLVWDLFDNGKSIVNLPIV